MAFILVRISSSEPYQLFEVEQALGPPDVVCPMERIPGIGMKQQEVRLNAPGIMQNTGLHQLQSP